jgi:hypothetical protein
LLVVTDEELIEGMQNTLSLFFVLTTVKDNQAIS